MAGPRNRRIRGWAVWCGAVLTAVGSPARAGDDEHPLAEWSNELWTSAARGGMSDGSLDVLERVPEAGGEGAVASLHAAVDLFKTNLSKREESRSARMAEVTGELEGHAASGELLKGLRSAIELHTLSRDKSQVLARPDVQAMVGRAASEAAKAESEARWLDAHNLYNRLNLLYDELATYEADLRRLGQRLLMLRLYVPERLYEMRNAQRIAEGEDALPPYNKVGEDWHEKLAGIDERMVLRSIRTAGELHVDHVTVPAMLVGGYKALRTMVTTPDLAAAFESLANPAAVAGFVDHLDRRTTMLADPEARVTDADLRDAVRQLLKVNDATVKMSPEALLHEFANGAMAELDDFSSVIWPDELAQFQRTTDGTFKGVGIQITLNDALEIKVVTPLEGTPAAKAGLHAGDLIRKIDGDSTLGMSLTQAVERITGAEGTAVVLTVEREGEEGPIEFHLRRAEIPIYSVKGWVRTGARETDWDWFIDDQEKIGYVRVTQFNNKTSQEVKAAAEQMIDGGLRGLIVDLRNNPGGLLSEAVSITSLFVNGGLVVTQEDNQGQERERQTAPRGQSILGDVPVVVLVNGGSASASEIVAGALQDYQRAIIVGDRSFGKGSVQNVFGLGRAAFKLTTQYYRLPGRNGEPGRLIHRRPKASVWGIEPDFEVEMLPKQFADALEVRQDADVASFDAEGNLVVDDTRPDPSKLIDEGLDPQLEAALLLLRGRVVADDVLGARARLN